MLIGLDIAMDVIDGGGPVCKKFCTFLFFGRIVEVTWDPCEFDEVAKFIVHPVDEIVDEIAAIQDVQKTVTVQNTTSPPVTPSALLPAGVPAGVPELTSSSSAEELRHPGAKPCAKIEFKACLVHEGLP